MYGTCFLKRDLAAWVSSGRVTLHSTKLAITRSNHTNHTNHTSHTKIQDIGKGQWANVMLFFSRALIVSHVHVALLGVPASHFEVQSSPVQSRNPKHGVDTERCHTEERVRVM